MSKEMREQIDRVKNWKQFLNENELKYLTLYHGSDTIFDKFISKENVNGFNAFGDGIYFVDNINEAKDYGDYIYECEVYMNKIFDANKNIEFYNKIRDINMNTTPILINNGFDTLKINKNYYNIYVVFNINNIKIKKILT